MQIIEKSHKKHLTKQKKSAAFEEILRRFTYQNRPMRRWNGYTLLAVDGSHVQIPSNIHDEATYFNAYFPLTWCTAPSEIHIVTMSEFYQKG